MPRATNPHMICHTYYELSVVGARAVVHHTQNSRKIILEQKSKINFTLSLNGFVLRFLCRLLLTVLLVYYIFFVVRSTMYR